MATTDGGATAGSSTPRILFVSREPIAHQHGGSTTYALGLLQLLEQLGARVTVLVTLSASRSARPWFVLKTPYPHNLDVRIPGYVRVGGVYLRLGSPRAWARLLLRAADRRRWLSPAAALAASVFGDRICRYAWDLTEPTAAERKLVRRAVNELRPGTVLANYAFWGGELAAVAALTPVTSPHLPKTAILMHDLLSARVRSFEVQGRPLDCPRIDEATELRWLNGADTLLAAQAREAAAIAARVRGNVLVLPVTMLARAPAPQPQPGRCLFVGSRIAPNEEALAWLLDEVWPRVVASHPAASLAVVGTVAAALPQLAPQGVLAIGPVPSLDAEYDRAAVCVIPLRIGSGIKIKLLEALSYGKAIVSTPVGVEGLEPLVAGVVAVESHAEDFAQAIVALLRDDVRRRALEASAYALAQQHFDPRRQLDPAFLNGLL